MSHDFAKTKKKRPKSRRKSKTQSKVGAAAWVLTGVVSGLFISFIAYLVILTPAAHQRAQHVASDQTVLSSVGSRAVAKAQQTLERIPVESRELGQATRAGLDSVKKRIEAQGNHRPRFEFYQLLPEREVKVPKESVATKAAEKHDYTYVLQAGSFKSLSDADRLRAKLIMMGLDSSIESNKNPGGTTWHRVMVGPLDNRSERAKARSALIDEGINTLVIKRKLG